MNHFIDTDVSDLIDDLLAAVISCTNSGSGFIAELVVENCDEPAFKAVARLGYSEQDIQRVCARVWAERSTVLITCDVTDATTPAQEASGRQSAFIGVPLLINEALIGVLGTVSDRGTSEERMYPHPPLVAACARAIHVLRHSQEAREKMHALQAREARMCTIVDQVPDGIITLDAEGTITAINIAAEQIFDYKAADVVGDGLAVLLPDLAAGKPAEGLRRYIGTADMRLMAGRETVGQRRDGSKFALDMAVTKLTLDDVTTYVCVVRDITERKDAEHQLRETMTLQRAILDSANYSIINTDSSGVIRLFNRAAQRWLQYSEDEVVGNITPAVIHDPQEVVRRAAALTEELGAPVEPGFETFVIKSRLGLADENEWTYIRKDGSRFPVLLSVTTLRNEFGEISGYLGIASDITERKRAEDRLRETLTLQRAILDSANYSIINTDPSGLIKLFNRSAQRWLGYTEEEVIDKVTPAIIHDPQEVVRRAAELTAELNVPVEPGFAAFVAKSQLGKPDENEWTYIRKDGSRFPVLLSVTTLRDQQGEISGYLGVASDITERKKVELSLMQKTAELERSNRELDEFAYITSHDLKAPLRAIANLSRWIEEDLADKLTDESRQHMETLRGRVQRMEKFIEGILEYSRIGRVDDEIELTDVGGLLTEIIDAMVVPEGYQIKITGKMPLLRCKRLRLGQVFANLISNAIKYRAKDDGKVEVSVEEYDQVYAFVVRDDGIGIDSRYHEKIFGIFQTLLPRDKVESTGIGLSLVKKIVEEQGGAITVSSEEGKGSEFTFTWPKQFEGEIAA